MYSLSSKVILVLILIACSCQDSGYDPQTASVPVVEAFLFKGEVVDDINVSRLVPFTDSGAVPYLNDLEITLIWNGEGFLLEASPGDSGYYHYPGSDLLIEQGRNYQLEFLYEGKLISAETMVPSPPQGISVSQTDIEIPPIASRFDFINLRNIEDLEVSWDNPGGEYYYVLVENVEENPQPVVTEETLQGFRRNFRFVSEPVQDDFHIIRGITLEQYGLHRVQVFRVNQEYVDLFENIDQDSRNLNEPPTNIANGLGIFTAFNSDSIFFEVKKP